MGQITRTVSFSGNILDKKTAEAHFVYQSCHPYSAHASYPVRFLVIERPHEPAQYKPMSFVA